VIRAAAANGVPLDEPDELGDTALMIAAAKGHEEVVKALLLAGARGDLVNSFGQTAAQVAYANGRSAIHDVLQRAALSPRPARPPAPPGKPPRVGAILLAGLLAGTLAYVALAWGNGAWPTRIDFQAAMQLIRDKQTRFAVYWPMATSAPGSESRPLPDIYGLVNDPRRHPELSAGRFITSPPGSFHDTPGQRQLIGGVASWLTSSDNLWPSPAWGWWPVLAIGQAGLYAGLMWLAGYGRLFGLLPRRG
jgi:hypothetical protein